MKYLLSSANNNFFILGKYFKRDMFGTSGHKPPIMVSRPTILNLIEHHFKTYLYIYGCIRVLFKFQQVCQALSTLCEDPNNTVFVVSGDSQENITDSVGNIRNLGLAASNGACFSNPVENGERERSWKYFDLGVDWEAVKRVSCCSCFQSYSYFSF